MEADDNPLLQYKSPDPFELICVIATGTVALSALQFKRIEWVELHPAMKNMFVKDLHTVQDDFVRPLQLILIEKHDTGGIASMPKIWQDGMSHENFPISPFLGLMEEIQTDNDVQIRFDADTVKPFTLTTWELLSVSLHDLTKILAHAVQEESIGRETLAKIRRWLDYCNKIIANLSIKRRIGRDRIGQLAHALKNLDKLHSEHFADIYRNSNDNKEFSHFSPGSWLIAIVTYIQLRCSLLEQQLEDEQINDDNFSRYLEQKGIWEETIGSVLADTLEYSNVLGGVEVKFAYINKLPFSALVEHSGRRRELKVNPFDIFHQLTRRVIDTIVNIGVIGYDDATEEFFSCFLRTVNFDLRDDQHKNRCKQYRSRHNHSEKYVGNWYPAFDNNVFLFGSRISKLFPNLSVSRSLGGNEPLTSTGY